MAKILEQMPGKSQEKNMVKVHYNLGVAGGGGDTQGMDHSLWNVCEGYHDFPTFCNCFSVRVLTQTSQLSISELSPCNLFLACYRSTRRMIQDQSLSQ